MSNKIAVSVGHYQGEPTRDIEYPANETVANMLHNLLVVNGFKAEIFHGKLPDKVRAINDYNPDIAIESHFNRLHWPYTDEYGSGYEVCIWGGSVYGKVLGGKIIEGFSNKLPFRRRGTGVLERTNLYFLKHTKCPALILEPLFLDNPLEAKFVEFEKGYQFIADAVYSGIVEYFKELGS